ncbi:MAG: hypothetical protein ACYC55_07375 [Candidatus Geothermincolia bacterium]
MEVPLSNAELKLHLKEQIEILSWDADSYDKGKIFTAKNMATHIRVLLHDGKWESLLTQLGRKDIPFYDTAAPLIPGNLTPGYAGLVATGIGPAGINRIAPLDAGCPGHALNRRIPFDYWWGQTVIEDTQHRLFSRSKLVLTISDKCGGAHVDSSLEKAFAELLGERSLGWSVTIDGETSTFHVGAAIASIRQITHEVLRTLRGEFPELV